MFPCVAEFKYSTAMLPKLDPIEGRIQIGPKKKIALVCGGGAMKAAAFHLGVALALEEQGFKFYGGLQTPSGPSRQPGPMEISTYVGSSAGSIFCSYLASGYSVDNIFNAYLGKKVPAESFKPKNLSPLTYQKVFRLRSNLNSESSLSIDQISQVRKLWGSFAELVDGKWEALMKFRWLKMTGIFSTSGIEQYLREEVLPSNRFQDFLPDFYVVATQLNHSRNVIFGKESYHPPEDDLSGQYEDGISISEACAASTALPVIYSPYAIKQGNESVHYIDGEVRETLSSHVAVDAGADLVIASNTHQPYHLTETTGSLEKFGLPSIVIQTIFLMIEQKIKKSISVDQAHRKAIDAVFDYCKKEGLPERHRLEICEILERELHHRRNVDTIYIHPKPTDTNTYFGSNFSLSRRMSDIVKAGFSRAVEILKQYEFADRENKPAIGMARLNV